MLREVQLENFKCFEHLKLDCAPLSLLCGLNGTGKSSLIQALLVLRQSFASRALEDGRPSLRGELAGLGDASDVLFQHAKMPEAAFSLGAGSEREAWSKRFRLSSIGRFAAVRADEEVPHA